MNEVRAVMELESEKRMTKMEADLDNIKELLLDIKDTLKNMDNVYVRKSELLVMLEQRDKEIVTLQTSKNNMPNWISSIVAIIAVIIAYFK
jgi:hypothetical protein